MNTLLLILAFALAGYSANDPDDGERLKAFLKKLEHVRERQKNNVNKWPMPLYQPGASDNMPQMDLYSVDPETGLEYSKSRNVIRDRTLEFEMDIASGTIADLKTGKKFSYKELTDKKKREG